MAHSLHPEDPWRVTWRIDRDEVHDRTGATPPGCRFLSTRLPASPPGRSSGLHGRQAVAATEAHLALLRPRSRRALHLARERRDGVQQQRKLLLAQPDERRRRDVGGARGVQAALRRVDLRLHVRAARELHHQAAQLLVLLVVLPHRARRRQLALLRLDVRLGLLDRRHQLLPLSLVALPLLLVHLAHDVALLRQQLDAGDVAHQVAVQLLQLAPPRGSRVRLLALRRQQLGAKLQVTLGELGQRRVALVPHSGLREQPLLDDLLLRDAGDLHPARLSVSSSSLPPPPGPARPSAPA
mmetsp:Transcript_29227/g.73437  ORF Transcript_29227/g.73437 Transcript_29227/m.73437 type:complete len:297 (-) Transcript_29227:268-1158(-)